MTSGLPQIDEGAPAQTADQVIVEVGAVLSDTVDALAQAGVRVTEGWPAGIDPEQSAESFGFQVSLFFAFAQPGEQDFAPLAAVIEQERRGMAARAAWSDYFRDVDVFVCPVNFTAAFPHDPRPFGQRTIATADGERPYTDQPFWIAHASLAGLPAVAAPTRPHIRRASRRRADHRAPV